MAAKSLRDREAFRLRERVGLAATEGEAGDSGAGRGERE